MKTRELGLVLTQQLMGVEDLHYGYWDIGVTPRLADLEAAQARYSSILIEKIEHCTPPAGRILDIGCGTGHLLVQLLDRGYRVDGVIPDDYLERQVRHRIASCTHVYQPQIFNDKFERFPDGEKHCRYDLLLFSESFQYIPYKQNIALWQKLLKPEAHVLICDFFKSVHDGDGQPGDGIFRGGHPYAEFIRYLTSNHIDIVSNDDITRHTSPSIGLLNDLLMNRIHPAMETLDCYLSTRRPWLLKVVKWLFRRRLNKVREKYLTGLRTQKVFERYKTYRLMVLKPPSGGTFA